ncbi:mutator type transposase [Tanacetum coccineum]
MYLWSLYQVSGPWDDQVVVNVVARTCTCRRWELAGIPCKHVVATNWVMSLNNEAGIPEEWVHPCYRFSRANQKAQSTQGVGSASGGKTTNKGKGSAASSGGVPKKDRTKKKVIT